MVSTLPDVPCCETCNVPITIPAFTCPQCGDTPSWDTVYAFADVYFDNLTSGHEGLSKIACFVPFMKQDYFDSSISPLIFYHLLEAVYSAGEDCPMKLILTCFDKFHDLKIKSQYRSFQALQELIGKMEIDLTPRINNYKMDILLQKAPDLPNNL